MMDEDHKVQFKFLNAFSNLSPNTTNSEVLKLVTEFFNFSKGHFKTEEALMATMRYPKLGLHMQHHRSFITWVGDALIEFASPNSTKDFTMSVKTLVSHLTKWLGGHVSCTDREFALFMMEHPLSFEALAQSSSQTVIITATSIITAPVQSNGNTVINNPANIAPTPHLIMATSLGAAAQFDSASV